MSTPLASVKMPKISRKQRRFKKEVAELQSRSHTILPQTTFLRLVREIGAKSNEHLRWNTDAVKALQYAAEEELTQVFCGAGILAQVAKRDTVQKQDIQIFQKLRSL